MKGISILALILAVPVAGAGGLIAYGVHLEREVEYWNRTIDELCSADGGKNVGLRVYERVMAPDSYLRAASGATPAYLSVPWRYEGRPVKEGEPFVEEMRQLEVIRAENPKVAKYAVRIIRVADEKILAEQIKYMRSGGGISMPDPSAAHICPTPEKSRIGTNALYNEVFINHPLNQSQE